MITKTGSLSLSDCMEPNMASYYLDDENELRNSKPWDRYSHGLNPLPTQLEVIENFLANKIWITKDKERIRVEDMTNTHIVNTINAFERKKINPKYLGGKDRWLEIFQRELSKRGI